MIRSRRDVDKEIQPTCLWSKRAVHFILLICPFRMVLRQVEVFVGAARIDSYTRARTYRYLTLIVEQLKKCTL